MTPKDGRLVVSTTRDGGLSFQALTAGVPQDGAWDLIFRHALWVDASGRAAGDGIDDRESLGFGERRRKLAGVERDPAAGGGCGVCAGVTPCPLLFISNDRLLRTGPPHGESRQG